MQRKHTVVGLLVNRLAALAQALLVLINAQLLYGSCEETERRFGNERSYISSRSCSSILREREMHRVWLTKVESVFGMRDLWNKADEVALFDSWY